MLEKFKVLNDLAAELRRHGLEVEVRKDSICLGRKQWDKYSRLHLLMLSAVPHLNHRDKGFFIYLTEQHDASGTVRKFSIKLCDDGNAPIRSYDLDTKRGGHIHDYVGSTRGEGHKRFSSCVSDIVMDMLNRMCAY